MLRIDRFDAFDAAPRGFVWMWLLLPPVPPGASSKTSKRYRRVQHPFPHPQQLYLQRSPWSISQGAAPWRDGLSICVQAEPGKAEVRNGRCRLCTIWSGILCKWRCDAHGLVFGMPPRPWAWDRLRPRPQALLVCVSPMRVATHRSQRSRSLTRPLALPVILGNAMVAMWRFHSLRPLRIESRRRCMISVSAGSGNFEWCDAMHATRSSAALAREVS